MSEMMHFDLWIEAYCSKYIVTLTAPSIQAREGGKCKLNQCYRFSTVLLFTYLNFEANPWQTDFLARGWLKKYHTSTRMLTLLEFCCLYLDFDRSHIHQSPVQTPPTASGLVGLQSAESRGGKGASRLWIGTSVERSYKRILPRFSATSNWRR